MQAVRAVATVNLSSRLTQIKAIHARHMSQGNGFYDIIISGGGLVGGAMACAVGSSPYFEGKKALILEAQSAPTEPKTSEQLQPYSNRVCAISPSSKKLLKRFGAWKHISRKGTVKKMQVWDACSDALITFDREDMMEDLCYIVENNMITESMNRILREQLAECCEIRYDTEIESFSTPKNYIQEDVNYPLPNAVIALKTGEELETSLLVAADGAKSTIAQKASFPKISWEYKQSAVVTTLKLSECSENIVAWQRFLPTGPVAMLPLDEQNSSLVWSTSREHAEELMAMDEEEFVSEVNDAFTREYPKNEIVHVAREVFNSILSASQQETPSLQLPPKIESTQGDRAKFPLGLNHCTEYVRPRLALIGDAAHRVHPLAGQGANLGFGDVKCLLETLEQAIYEGRDIGTLSQLMKYESERQMHNTTTMAVIDGLNKLYTTDSPPVVLLRTLGLMGTNANKFIKDQIMDQAAK